MNPIPLAIAAFIAVAPVTIGPPPPDYCKQDPDCANRKFFDPDYTSCTSFIAHIAATHFGFDTAPVADLIAHRVGRGSSGSIHSHDDRCGAVVSFTCGLDRFDIGIGKS